LVARDRRLKQEAVRSRGDTCEVCGFDFADVYGEMGKGYIEIHHLRPLSQVKGRRVSVSVEGVALVCPDCHRMLHRKGVQPLPLEELRKVVANQRRKRKGKQVQ